jgi:lysophospholipase L1-like esterase
MRAKLIVLLGLITCTLATAQQPAAPQAMGASLERFHPVPAPQPKGLVLKRGDRLAICGDSITEQKMYSRLMEDYLTMCAPDLNVSVRQYGWGGERAPGFLARMTNDCLRFKPTIATTCYGMNDHEYRTYEERIGQTYREKSTAIVEAFKANGVRVIQGSPGCVGKVPGWTKHTNDTVTDLNLNLCNLRNIDIEIAQKEKVGFADVFWPMLTAGVTARERYATNYAIAGGDGVHPGWAGHTVMAYAFLKAMGLKGEIGTFTVDLKRNKMKVSKGHEVVSAKDGEFEIKSVRYPFCPCLESGQGAASYPVCGKDDPTKDSSIRSGMTLVPFDQDMNRLMLVAKNGKAASYKVTWGGASKTFSAEQLARGVNLAEEFPCNPFCEAFAKVDAAVAAKQAYETKQIKQAFRSAEAKTDMEGVAARTEEERTPLAEAIHAAFVPVTHTVTITPL